jgi:hypothetical protein
MSNIDDTSHDAQKIAYYKAKRNLILAAASVNKSILQRIADAMYRQWWDHQGIIPIDYIVTNLDEEPELSGRRPYRMDASRLRCVIRELIINKVLRRELRDITVNNILPEILTINLYLLEAERWSLGKFMRIESEVRREDMARLIGHEFTTLPIMRYIDWT